MIIGEIIGVIMAMAGLIALVASGVAYYRSQYTSTTLNQLKELTEALQLQVDFLKAERDELKEGQKDLLDRIKVVEEENKILRGLVTGEAKIQEVLRVIDANHAQVIEAIHGLSKKD